MKRIFPIVILSLVFIFYCSSIAVATDSYYKKGNPEKYTLVQHTVLTNNSNSVVRDISLHLPLMDSKMPIYQEFVGEQLSPYPNRIVYGANGDNGSREAIYNIASLAPGERLVFEQRYAIVCYSINYTFTAADIPDNYSRLPLYIYTEPSLYVESDSQEIIDFAKKALAYGKNPYLLAKNLFSQVNLYMTYKDGINANKGALNAVRSAEGVCEDYTDLFVASLRALNIPARQMTGYLYMPADSNQQQYKKQDGSVDLTAIGHTWPEFYLPNVDWVFADPTFTYLVNVNGVDKKFIDWSFFANIPDSRKYIFFREGSASAKLSYFSSSGGDLTADISSSLLMDNQFLPYNDLAGHWASDAVCYLYNYEDSLVKGVGNGLYGVNLPITRAQLAVFLQRVKDPPSATLSFPDVSSTHWAAQAIASAKEQGWLAGYADGTFRPNQQLTRAEMAAVLVRAFNISKGDFQVEFKDLGLPGYSWADSSIIILASNNLAGGDGKGNFMPQKTVTRAEFAVFFSKILQNIK
ncbi:MAG: S-layer homology domain-containing protein [Bacillota bacterium]|jgi:hypothetical protein